MSGDVALPSGLAVDPLDRIVETQADGQVWITLRYVTPRIDRATGDLGYDDIAEDLDRLCEVEGLAAAKDAGGVDQVIITLMDRPVERGAADPDATMFIGAYVPTDDGCLWQ